MDHYCFLLLLRGWCDTICEARSLVTGGLCNLGQHTREMKAGLHSSSPNGTAVTFFVTSELLLISHSLKDAKFISLPFNFWIFFLLSANHIHECAHKYTHGPAHTGAHPTLRRVHTLHCVLENKELACILFGVNQNVRLKLLFYAFESHTRQTHACLTKLWTSKGIFHRKKTHTHTKTTDTHKKTTHTNLRKMPQAPEAFL